MPAQLIWDSLHRDHLAVPERMGKPTPTQLQGSPLDNLAELAGRVCYDSLGAEKSRGSVEYHQHIRDVKHVSVYRHCAFTAIVPYDPVVYLNRPGLYVRLQDEDDRLAGLRVTLNLQHVVEWGRVKPLDKWVGLQSHHVAKRLAGMAYHLAPLAAGPIEDRVSYRNMDAAEGKIVAPMYPEERWLSFHIHGVSRGLTHELVRHGAYTAPSQRSTRYCDEAESDWAWHPLVRDGWLHEGKVKRLSPATYAALNTSQEMCQEAYQDVVREMTANGVDRKQARGAARGVLGNALSTELIFSASLARWREIGALRNHPTADGEIRELFAEIADLLPA